MGVLYTEFCRGDFFQVFSFKFVSDRQSIPPVVHTGCPDFDSWRDLALILSVFFILFLDEPWESFLVV